MMADDSIIYDRNVLYEEIWAEPMRDVTKRYGVSDVALAKTCRRLGVPVPGRGYWAKLKAGKADRDRRCLSWHTASPNASSATAGPSRRSPRPWRGSTRRSPSRSASRSVVADTLENPHKLLALSARYLAKAHPKDGLVSAPQRSCLDIHVSPDVARSSPAHLRRSPQGHGERRPEGRDRAR